MFSSRSRALISERGAAKICVGKLTINAKNRMKWKINKALEGTAANVNVTIPIVNIFMETMSG